MFNLKVSDTAISVHLGIPQSTLKKYAHVSKSPLIKLNIPGEAISVHS